jgi:hypothetical protein
MKKVILVLVMILAFELSAQDKRMFFEGIAKVETVSDGKAFIRFYNSQRVYWILNKDKFGKSFVVGFDYNFFIKSIKTKGGSDVSAKVVYDSYSIKQNNILYKKKMDSIAFKLRVKRNH